MGAAVDVVGRSALLRKAKMPESQEKEEIITVKYSPEMSAYLDWLAEQCQKRRKDQNANDG